MFEYIALSLQKLQSHLYWQHTAYLSMLTRDAFDILFSTFETSSPSYPADKKKKRERKNSTRVGTIQVSYLSHHNPLSTLNIATPLPPPVHNTIRSKARVHHESDQHAMLQAYSKQRTNTAKKGGKKLHSIAIQSEKQRYTYTQAKHSPGPQPKHLDKSLPVPTKRDDQRCERKLVNVTKAACFRNLQIECLANLDRSHTGADPGGVQLNPPKNF